MHVSVIWCRIRGGQMCSFELSLIWLVVLLFGFRLCLDCRDCKLTLVRLLF